MNIISFYTDQRYKTLCKTLKASTDRFGHILHSKFANNCKTWPEAIKFKPLYILSMYQKLGGPLLYLDADCELKKQITYIEQLGTTFDVCLRRRDLHDTYNCGVMYFGPNKDKIIPLLRTWIEYLNDDPYSTITVDQKPFEKALQKHSDILIGNLTYEYNYLPADVLSHDPNSAVIKHYKESKINEKADDWRIAFFKKYPKEKKRLRKPKKRDKK